MSGEVIVIGVELSLAVRCLLAFLCGAAHEALNVAWVHYSERNAPWRATMVAIVNSTVALVGIVGSVTSIHVAASYVLGEASGTWLAIWMKGRKKGI